MGLHRYILGPLRNWAFRKIDSRAPDFVIGANYLERWWVIPRNTIFNIYLHRINKSDDDRALHDHPWLNCSIVLSGGYWEHSIRAGGVELCEPKLCGSVTFRRSVAAHRLEIAFRGSIPAITLFITGPRIRSWGFHCPKAGWRHWRDFTADGDSSQVGRGCGE